jgi:NAD(P)-dependent dehydrogenase (short-subunit alcohol dehydrogenase family)
MLIRALAKISEKAHRLKPMTQRFADKNVLVIGGNSGIGLASAKAFAMEGAKVAIAGRDLDTLHQAIEEINHGASAYQCDISDLTQVAALYSEVSRVFNHIDVLFVSAGVLAYAPIEAVTEEDWDWMQAINLKGTFFSVQRALPLLRKGSCVVLTGSTAGTKAVPTAAVYAVMKSGLRGLGRQLAAALIEGGIRVNIVSPGPTETPMFHRTRGIVEDAVPALCQSLIETIPMKRMSKTDEVSAAVLFLASDAAAFINGVELFVDSGIASF